MSTSDKLAILALVVSTLSLAVSLVAFYFQFLRKTQLVKLTLLDCISETVINTESLLVINLAFANLGNQSAVLSKVELAFERNNKNRVILPEVGGRSDPIIL